MRYATSVRQAVLPESIQKTLANTFWTVGGMMTITAVASYMSLGLKMGWGMALVLFLASLGLLFSIGAFRNSAFGLVLLGVFSTIQGVTLGPVLTHYLKMPGGSGIVSSAALLTAVATFGCAAYAITTRKSFSHLSAFLFGGTLLLLVAMLLGMFVKIPAFHLAISVVGAVLFLGWLLYDISEVVTGQETNYISAALGIYLDILNLFTNLLRMFGILSADD